MVSVDNQEYVFFMVGPLPSAHHTCTVPLILKGVQCWEDALEAYDRGLAGVVLSNHGGRQLEFSRSGVETLVEVVRELKACRGLTFPNEKFQLFVDGGVRRATDVLKAVALGATAGKRAICDAGSGDGLTCAFG